MSLIGIVALVFFLLCLMGLAYMIMTETKKKDIKKPYMSRRAKMKEYNKEERRWGR